MSREIKFKAKCKQFNEWFYGDLVQELGGEKRTFILDCGVVKNESEFDDFAVEVYTETVCQFTGLKDKNGKEIYEGDRINSFGRIGVIQFGYGRFGINWDYEINIDPFWKDGCMFGSWGSKDNLRELSDEWNKEIEVIGSIHDKEVVCQ